MQIGVKGTPRQTEELKMKIGSLAEISELKITNSGGYDLIFDLSFDLDRIFLPEYLEMTDTPLILGSAAIQLEEVFAGFYEKLQMPFIGMNTLPTFINRSHAEVCFTDPKYRNLFTELLEKLGYQCGWVGSRVGMVTPRVVLMIINEAYYTFMEGTATREDIDLGMKLGTNYPKGPFAWANEIGLDYVYHTLEAVFEDTHDPRYKICPLLKTEYLKTNL